jgi:hypothetical protein
MAIIKQLSRMQSHRITFPSVVFTVPGTEDFTDGSWTSTDLMIGEFGVNVNDDRVFVRTMNGIIEMMSNANDLWELDSGGDIVPAFASPAYNVLVPTQLPGDNSDRVATTAYVDAAVAAVDTSDTFSITVDGQGSVISTGIANYAVMKRDGVITGWNIVSSITGSVVFDVWVVAGGVLPTVADTITAAAKPTLSSDVFASSTSVGTWTVAFSAGDIVGFNVDSVTDCEQVTLSINYI